MQRTRQHAWWLVPALLALSYPLIDLLLRGAELRLLRSALWFVAPVAGIVVLCALDRTHLDALQRKRAAFWAAMAVLSPATFVVATVVVPRLGITVQAPLWRSLSVALVALVSGLWVAARHRGPHRAPRPTPAGLVAVHRISASLLLVFALLHLGNHAMAFWSLALNVAVFEVVRSVYRGPFLDPLVVTVVATQVVSGVILFAYAAARRGNWVDRLQAYSGLYLAVFLSIHTIAIVFLVQGGIDFPRATGGRRGSIGSYFLPYYVLGPAAFFTHVTCAVSRLSPVGRPRLERVLVRSAAALGVAVCLAITLALFAVRVKDGGLAPPSRSPTAALAPRSL